MYNFTVYLSFCKNKMNANNCAAENLKHDLEEYVLNNLKELSFRFFAQRISRVHMKS